MYWLVVIVLRGHPLSTYADFSAFWTPSPLCTYFEPEYTSKFTQPRLLRTLLGPLPLGAYVLNGWSLIFYCPARHRFYRANALLFALRPVIILCLPAAKPSAMSVADKQVVFFLLPLFTCAKAISDERRRSTSRFSPFQNFRGHRSPYCFYWRVNYFGGKGVMTPLPQILSGHRSCILGAWGQCEWKGGIIDILHLGSIHIFQLSEFS